MENKNRKYLRKTLVYLGVGAIALSINGVRDNQINLSNNEHSSLHIKTEDMNSFSDILKEKYGATFTPEVIKTPTPTPSIVQYLANKNKNHTQITTTEPSEIVDTEEDPITFEETTVESSEPITTDIFTTTEESIDTEIGIETSEPETDEPITIETTTIEHSEPEPEEITTIEETTAEETTKEETIIVTPPQKTNHYAVNNYNAKEQEIINNSLCSMKSLNNFENLNVNNVEVPEKFKELNEKVFNILDNKICNSPDNMYNNVLKYKGCTNDWFEFEQWFLDTYSIELKADTYDFNCEYDHVDLDVLTTAKYHDFADTTLTALLARYQQEYIDFSKFAKKTINMLGIDKNTREIDALWKIHNYILDNYSYDNSYNNDYLDSMLKYHTGTCNAYALLMKLLARECGIDCQLLVCKKDNTIKHASNVITLHDGNNSVQMLIDSTLADSRKNNEFMFGVSIPSGVKQYYNEHNYNNFDITNYENLAGYISYAIGHNPPICSYTYDTRSGLSTIETDSMTQ